MRLNFFRLSKISTWSTKLKILKLTLSTMMKKMIFSYSAIGKITFFPSIWISVLPFIFIISTSKLWSFWVITFLFWNFSNQNKIHEKRRKKKYMLICKFRLVSFCNILPQICLAWLTNEFLILSNTLQICFFENKSSLNSTAKSKKSLPISKRFVSSMFS